MQDIYPDTPCLFMSEGEDHEDLGLSPGIAVGIDEDVTTNLLETTASDDGLKFWPWVNQVR